MTDESRISEFYSNKKIFVTGGTGCMGKVLIWKLLHSCPKVHSIYALMRPKYGKNPMSRKEELFGSAAFENLKKNNPKVFDKVIFVSGDVGEEGIGLSESIRNELINEVEIVFHSAAVLKMDSDLQTAVNVNTVGTIRMLNLAMKMKKLEAFVHISTAYCCCENLTVEEKIYPPTQNPHDIINLIQWMKPELLRKITPDLIYPLPNTYIYTKRLAEAVLTDYASKVPIIVARPSIVVPAVKEPVAGWTDSLNGPVGLFSAGGKGFMRVSMMNIDMKGDVIPVDIAINGILTLPWANPIKERLLEEIKVYNVSQTPYHPEDLSWRQVITYFKNANEKYPYEKILWYSSFEKAFTQSPLVYAVKNIFMHYLPAYIIDFILILVGQKPFLVRAYDKLGQGEKVLRYFTQKQWKFVRDNLSQIEKVLSDTDKQIFKINMSGLSIQTYAYDAIIGTKLYIFKEDMSTLDSARRTGKIMYVVDKMTLAFRYYLLWKILSYLFYMVLYAFGM